MPPMYCPHCGTEQKEGTRFCTHCGGDLDTSPRAGAVPPKTAAPPPAPGESRAGLYAKIGIASGIVAIFFVPLIFGPLGIILGYVARKDGEEQLGMYAIIAGIAGLVIGVVLAVVLSGQTLGMY